MDDSAENMLDQAIDATGGPLTLASMSPQLALELAMQLEEPSKIFTRYGYSDSQAQTLLGNEGFRRMIKEAHAKWVDANNAEARVRLKALMAVEEAIPDMFRMAVGKEVPHAARNDSFKTLSDLAGVRQRASEGGAGGNFSITMNFGSSKGKPEKVVIEGAS